MHNIFLRSGSRIEYEYDFGDGWRHEIKLEKKLEAGASQDLACLDGAYACPPDDCGGPWGYADMLQIIADPNHPEYQETREWLGKKFDPKVFDARKADTRLKKRFKRVTTRGWGKVGAELRP